MGIVYYPLLIANYLQKMKALIFAAGKGTRLKPFTDHHPKALALVNDVPLLERNIKYLQGFGINDFVINIHHFGELFRRIPSRAKRFRYFSGL